MTLVAPRKPHHTHKKRNGQHQHRRKHFAQTYWPYLPLLLIVALGFFVNSVLPTRQSVLGYATDMSSYGLLTSTNSQRTSNGLKALQQNSTLTTAAQNKAADMAAKDYWSHNSPSGKTPWDFMTAAGYSYQTAGENLAYGFDSSSATVTGWMGSPEHRANILNSSYTQVGFGIINIPNYQSSGPQTLVVAMYASPYVVASNPSPAPTTTSSSPTTSSSSPTSEPAPTPTSSETEPVAKPTTKKATPTDAESDTVTPKPAAQSQPVNEPAQQIARIQLVANGQAGWSLMVTLTIVAVALGLLLIRHGIAWHRLLNRGEAFVLRHPLLDIIAVAVITAGVILSQTVGVVL